MSHKYKVVILSLESDDYFLGNNEHMVIREYSGKILPLNAAIHEAWEAREYFEHVRVREAHYE